MIHLDDVMPGPLARRALVGLLLCACLLPAAAGAVTRTPSQEQAEAPGDDRLQRLRQSYRQAEDTFFTADQPDSIPTFTTIVEEISAIPATERGEELRRLLVDSLSYRARARLNLGEDADADADLRRIVEIDPGFEFDPDMVSPKLATTFEALRSELVGQLIVDASPADARVRVDGTRREWQQGSIPVLAGDHVVSVERPGYTVVQQEVRVEGGGMQTVEARLERTHPVVFLLARPAGATVRVDGREIGRIQEPDDTWMSAVIGETQSDHPRILIDDVQVGTHALRISMDGYRTLEQPLELAELSDYRMGPLELEPATGTLVLRGVPDSATVELLDGPAGASWERQPDADGASIELSPGTYSFAVEDADGALFEAEATLRDGERTVVDVDLRPAVTYLGILGGDELGREKLDAALVAAFGEDAEWSLRDRRSALEAALEEPAFDADRFRRLAEADPASWSEPFRRFQETLDRNTSGSLYVIGVLSDDLVATDADLWLLPGAPGPAYPDRVTVDLEQPEADLADRIGTIFGPFEPFRGRFGAAVVDTGVAGAPVVIDLVDDGPAARAGLLLGDLLLAVDGRELDGATDLERRIRETGPGGEIEVRYQRGVQSLDVRVPLEPAPAVVRPDFSGPPLAPLWALSERSLQQQGDTPGWLLQLNRVAILIRAAQWEAAVQQLRRIRAPEGAGVGAGMVEYWLGMALQALGDDYRDLAREAFERAAAQRQARMFHADGPYVWPRAQARADALRR